LECLLSVLSLRLHKCLKTIDMKPRDGKDAIQDYVILVTALFFYTCTILGKGW
jgi:hypothetical protein